jgi:uncharacterized membrane-anchored protein
MYSRGAGHSGSLSPSFAEQHGTWQSRLAPALLDARCSWRADATLNRKPGEVSMSGNYGIAALGRAACLSMLLVAGVWAQQSPPQTEATAKADPSEAVWNAAQSAMVHGPQVIELSDQGKLSLPEGYSFVPKNEGGALMKLMGNQTDDRFLGLILPENATWIATVDYEPSGYIKDDDAKDWDAEELLQSLKEGTAAANEQRRAQGIAPIEVTKWVEAPSYDAPQHRLVWSAEAREVGGQDPDPTINYNTYVLGREGYISLNLITSSSQIQKDKPVAHQLLSGIEFNDGKRYADFNADTDKVAAYGLATLVGGLAANKLGLLALAAAVFAKFGKLILIGLAALAGILVKVFKGRQEA